MIAHADVVPAMRTGIGKLLIANSGTVVLDVTVALLLLDQDIASLDRHNSPEAQEELTQYRELKRLLEKVGAECHAFVLGEVSEATVVETSKSFAQYIRSWWEKCHVGICNKALDAGIFLLCLGICESLKVDADLAALVSAVIVDKKGTAQALRSAADFLKNLPRN